MSSHDPAKSYAVLRKWVGLSTDHCSFREHTKPRALELQSSCLTFHCHQLGTLSKSNWEQLFITLYVKGFLCCTLYRTQDGPFLDVRDYNHCRLYYIPAMLFCPVLSWGTCLTDLTCSQLLKWQTFFNLYFCFYDSETYWVFLLK